MKNFLLIFCLILFFQNSVKAEYIPIPNDLSKQYKIEMEKIINEEYSRGMNEINTLTKRAQKLYKKLIKNGYNKEDYINLTLIEEFCLNSADLNLYNKLMQVTQEKYLNKSYKPIGTDNSTPIAEYLFKYLEDNNIRTEKINKLMKYSQKKQSLIQKYIQDVENLFTFNFNNFSYNKHFI